MKVSANLNYTNFSGLKKLVPLSQYKGTILKLTDADKREIAKYQKRLADLELDLYKLNQLWKRSSGVKEAFYYIDKIQNISDKIESIKASIRAIKLNRLKIQEEI